MPFEQPAFLITNQWLSGFDRQEFLPLPDPTVNMEPDDADSAIVSNESQPLFLPNRKCCTDPTDLCPNCARQVLHSRTTNTGDLPFPAMI